MKYNKKLVFFALFLIAPSLLCVLFLDLLPILEAIVLSFFRKDLMNPLMDSFVGFANYYEALFKDNLFWGSLWRTILWAIGSVGISYIIGLSLALLLNQNIKGRGIFRALFLLPWVIPDVVAALTWQWLYNDQFGAINCWLMLYGIIDKPIPFLSDPSIALVSVIVAYVWKIYPFMTIVLLAGLQTIPSEIYESAIIDGANSIQKFLYITFPLLKKTTIISTLLMAMWSFNSFDLVYILTGGGPSNATTLLSISVYNKAFFSMRMGYAASLGVLTLIVLAIFSVFYIRYYGTQENL